MWTALRKDWDYLVLTFLLGLYVTASAFALIIALMLTLRATF
jgi:hypothetical protein